MYEPAPFIIPKLDLIEDSYRAFINLDHRNDRRNHMDKELVRVGLEADRFRAIAWQDIDPTPQTDVMRHRTPGAIGCHYSQVAVMEKALELGKHGWVMEDDLVFCDDFKERVKYMSDFLQGRSWDVLWLGGTFHSPAFWHKIGRSGMPPDCSAQLGKDYERTEDPRMMRTYGAFCTYAYIVNHSSIEKILKLFDEHLHTSIGIDWLFVKLQPELTCYAFVPGSVKQFDNKSDIGKGMTIFSGFSKLNGTIENSRYWFQPNMNDFNPDDFEWK